MPNEIETLRWREFATRAKYLAINTLRTNHKSARTEQITNSLSFGEGWGEAKPYKLSNIFFVSVAITNSSSVAATTTFTFDSGFVNSLKSTPLSP